MQHNIVCITDLEDAAAYDEVLKASLSTSELPNCVGVRQSG
jgi:hypothetical protein